MKLNNEESYDVNSFTDEKITSKAQEDTQPEN